MDKRGYIQVDTVGYMYTGLQMDTQGYGRPRLQVDTEGYRCMHRIAHGSTELQVDTEGYTSGYTGLIKVGYTGLLVDTEGLQVDTEDYRWIHVQRVTGKKNIC